MTIQDLVNDIKNNTDLTCKVMNEVFPLTFTEKLEMALEHMIERGYITINKR